MSDPMVQIIVEALAGKPASSRRLWAEITPAVHLAVADGLRRHLPASAWARVRHDVCDLAQEVFLLLFDKNGKRLRDWDPGFGISLAGYVKVIARNHTVSFLRTKRNQNTWAHQPIEPDELGELPGLDEGPALRVEEKQLLRVVLAQMERELTAEALRIFRMLFVEALEVSEICLLLDLTPNAVHVRQSRFLKQALDVTRSVLRER